MRVAILQRDGIPRTRVADTPDTGLRDLTMGATLAQSTEGAHPRTEVAYDDRTAIGHEKRER